VSAQYLSIKERTRPYELAPVSAADFVLSDGGDPDAQRVDAQVVLADPTLSLYCLDLAKGRALFVETPAHVDLSRAPFMYVAQHNLATRLLAVPLEEFHALAQQVDVRDEQITFIHSTGRCGSTLVSAAFNAVGDVVSLSEPDAFLAVDLVRAKEKPDDDNLTALLRSSVRLLCKPTPQIAAPRAWVIKFRAQELMLGNLFHRAFPRAHTIYLYRNADTWLRSIARAFAGHTQAVEQVERAQELRNMLAAMSPLLPTYLADPATSKSQTAMGTVMWLSNIERYLRLWESGVPMIAVRYEQLRAAPKAVLRHLFAYTGVTTSDSPTLDAALDAALDEVLTRDSQEGTAIAQTQQGEFELDGAVMAEIQAAIDWHPVIDRVDFIVPGTIELAEVPG
jgi:hypothetical protein